MIIVGCDYHPSFQQIAFVDTETGELKEQRLAHREGAEEFYRALAGTGHRVCGDGGQCWENRDLRQLLWHRHRMVQARTRIMNQLQAVALNEGLLCRKKLWRERGRQQLEAFRLAPWASRRRHDLLELLDRLNPTITELSQAIEREVEKCPAAQQLMTHPGVGSLTALAFVLISAMRPVFSVGSRWQAIWDWCRWKIPAEIGDGWDTSPSRGVPYCVFCWWKRLRSRYAACQSGAASMHT